MGAAEPAAKYVLARKLKARGARFATLIHPSAVISEYATIGEGCIVCLFSKIGANASVGGFVTVDGYIGHDNYIEDFVTLSTGTRLTGYVSVGEGSFFGAMCCVKPHTRIGKNCFITIGSTVVQDIPDNSYVKGTPEIRMTQNKCKSECDSLLGCYGRTGSCCCGRCCGYKRCRAICNCRRKSRKVHKVQAGRKSS